MKILLVEDERLIAEEIVGQLRSLGYADIDVEYSAADACTYIDACIPDLVIMDIELKGSTMDGITLAGRLQEDHTLPIIFLSSYSDTHTLARSKEVPHAHYLVKPCSTRQLFVSIDACLEAYVAAQSRTHGSTYTYSGPQCPLLAMEEYLFVKNTGSEYEKLYVADINWITAVRGGLARYTLWRRSA